MVTGAASLAIAAAPGASEGTDDDPAAVVRAFHARDSIRAYEFHSVRLERPFIEDERLAQGEVGHLDFAFHVNAQDTEDGRERTLRVALPKREQGRAEVSATSRDFRPQEIRYPLVREKGRWLIDDARSILGETWVLSQILAGGQGRSAGPGRGRHGL